METPTCPFSTTLGYFTFVRTYARRHDPNDPNSTVESWDECIRRVLRGAKDQLKCNFSEMEERELYDLLYNHKCSVAGRFLWQLGTDTVDKCGLPSLQNCAFRVINSPIEPFTWAMNFLMLGSGVGFRIMPADVAQLPVVKHAEITRDDKKDADFIVPDSREGWIKLLGKVLKAHFYSGEGFTYSCVLLRSKGAPIKGFGGTASGPDVLCRGMTNISTVLNSCAGRRPTPVDVLDIMNIIGMIVVSGNVRRSAQIAIGDCNDTEYLRAKRWDLGGVPNYRCFSNNSVVCNDINEVIDNDDFWAGYEGRGEPYGLVNLKLCRSCGRLGDDFWIDPTVEGMNPCAEITLSDGETCNLSDIYLPNVESREQLIRCTLLLYRLCKHSLALPCHISKLTEKVVHKNMRIGIGITGYLQASERQKGWLSSCYDELRAYDVAYSHKMGWPVSVKLTTVKPSGTLSLLAGVTPGVHPAYAKYYIRRVRIASESPLIKVAEKHGYHVEFQENFDGSKDPSTKIISFPMQTPDGTILADECTAVQQLEYVKRIQTDWADNSVSVTVTFKPEELPEIKQWLRKNYNNSVKSVSFLLYSGHGFKQAPIEPITKEKYYELAGKTTPITVFDNMAACESDEDKAVLDGCKGGACPIK
jgi:ribonucleoside-triphosphate reductase